MKVDVAKKQVSFEKPFVCPKCHKLLDTADLAVRQTVEDYFVRFTAYCSGCDSFCQFEEKVSYPVFLNVARASDRKNWKIIQPRGSHRRKAETKEDGLEAKKETK